MVLIVGVDLEAHVGFETFPLIGETLDKISKELERVEWELRGNHAISYVYSGGEVFLSFSFHHMKDLDLFLELELESHIYGLIFRYEIVPHTYGGHVMSNELPSFELERH